MAEKKVLRAAVGDARIGRILHEDDDFVTLEVGKRDDVVFHLQQDESGEVVGGDRFLTILFIRSHEGKVKVWDPFGDVEDS